MSERELLRVEELSVAIHGKRVVDRVSFTVPENEMVGVVGESGSGKTVTALALMNLFRSPSRPAGGQVWLRSRNLLAESEEYLDTVRGRQIAMIFQNPSGALNPLMRVGAQIERLIGIHQAGPGDLRAKALELLRQVGFSDPEVRARSYPHQLSGGMCQRVAIAMALACQPDLLIADEPTTGLDVTIEAQIFDLIKQLRSERRMSMLLITHDLGVVADSCHRVIVMYGGQVVEMADVDTIFHGHRHPYTQFLMASMLPLDLSGERIELEEVAMPYRGPLDFTMSGCRFSHRCPLAEARCFTERPALVELAPGHAAACHLVGEVGHADTDIAGGESL